MFPSASFAVVLLYVVYVPSEFLVIIAESLPLPSFASVSSFAVSMSAPDSVFLPFNEL